MFTYRLLFLLHPCKQIQTLDPAMEFKITKSTEEDNYSFRSKYVKFKSTKENVEEKKIMYECKFRKITKSFHMI